MKGAFYFLVCALYLTLQGTFATPIPLPPVAAAGAAAETAGAVGAAGAAGAVEASGASQTAATALQAGKAAQAAESAAQLNRWQSLSNTKKGLIVGGGIAGAGIAGLGIYAGVQNSKNKAKDTNSNSGDFNNALYNQGSTTIPSNSGSGSAVPNVQGALGAQTAQAAQIPQAGTAAQSTVTAAQVAQSQVQNPTMQQASNLANSFVGA